MQILDKIFISATEPPSTKVLWIKPEGEEVILYSFLNGKWTAMKVGDPGPNTIGSEQIMDNSVEMEDLNDSVKSKIQKVYDVSDESLLMDFDVQP